VTVSSTTNRVSYSGNGSTTAFAFSHPFRLTADLVVTVRTTATGAESLKTEGSDYTVSGTSDAGTGGYSSGTVTFSTAPATGTQIHIDRVVTRTQTVDLIAGDGIPPASIEGALDKLSLSVQELDARFARTLLQPRTAANRNLVLPEPTTATANQVLAISAAGTTYTLRTETTSPIGSVSVLDYGAVGNGSTDDSAAIQSAINAVNAAGGGVVFFPAKTFAVASSLTLKSNVSLHGYAATLLWTGGASPLVTTATSGIIEHCNIEGLEFDGSTTATKVVELYSAYHCTLRDVTLRSDSSTNFALDLLVNTSGGTNAAGNRNAAFCLFENVYQEGTCGTAIRMRGDASAPTVVTLCTFINFNCQGSCMVRGIDFHSWADNIHFAGMTRISIPSTATNGVGVEWNSSAPTSNVGVYSNNFDTLAVDTFGSGSGRVGAKMNYTKFNTITLFFQEPVAEGGDLVISSDCLSYEVTHALGGTNLMTRKVRGLTEKSLDVDSDSIRVRTAKTPASASATGSAGQICWDSSYLYICTATNTWRRIAHATF
jgi:hypothetical protein